jgi:hypothetical protein
MTGRSRDQECSLQQRAVRAAMHTCVLRPLSLSSERRAARVGDSLVHSNAVDALQAADSGRSYPPSQQPLRLIST